MAGLSLPFTGLPTVWVVLFTVALLVIIAVMSWTAVLFWRGRAADRNPPPVFEGWEELFTWIFLVPALNEEVTIADSVERLVGLPLRKRRVVVINDGSTDATAEILAGTAHPDLHVLHRRAPEAQLGKAAALNNAFRELEELVGEEDRENVIVTVVDADGRLHADSPQYAAANFVDSEVGGVQSLVRIYNTKSFLTWMQDVEFSIYGRLFQAGRNGWGIAGMGGNGQFNRLSALDSVADHEGPWRDRLTEDQDLGLRLISKGWVERQENRAIVDQQGLSNLRPLFRQRTRWSQGNLQATGLIDTVWRARISLLARFDLLAYLLMPLWQSVIGLTLIIAAVLAITGQAAVFGDAGFLQFLFFYALGFGGTMLGCIAARRGQGAPGVVLGIFTAQLYAFYSWLLWPVLVRSTARQLGERRSWAKTEREELGTS